ncbi:alpha/beta fold hydrolase [Derxia gummosa]|uniref:Alpha/beta fold hydrolase n=1 Tax=Derxia gummosa DSM 723 TaxID=1121388 RepID=A0A8B6XB18_9BURK|nr:alpha/beta hydrolase [Derxia gummosa]
MDRSTDQPAVSVPAHGAAPAARAPQALASLPAGRPFRIGAIQSGRAVELEAVWVGGDDPAAPVIVFLHEGLGSVSLWRDWPERLCRAAGWRGLVFSRAGYGQSTPRPADERWGPDFLHIQATEVLPQVLDAVGLGGDARPWLFGHSDGGSIALIFAAMFPQRAGGIVVAAPHIVVEPVTIASIEQARDAWHATDLRHKLARHHADPASAFLGWNDIWLDPAFAGFDITALLPRIACPVLAAQGVDDEYGTLEQVRGIARRVPQTELLELPDCRHSPHRDQPDALERAVTDFLRRNAATTPAAPCGTGHAATAAPARAASPPH